MVRVASVKGSKLPVPKAKQKKTKMRKQEPEEANRNVNMETATSDQSLITILDDIKSSKLPVIITGNSYYILYRFKTDPSLALRNLN